ncbi:MAG: hypothetical protein ACE5LU_12655 [Anaerolineae bacterium]
MITKETTPAPPEAQDYSDVHGLLLTINIKDGMVGVSNQRATSEGIVATMSYIVELDQSGKLEQTNWDTVLAFSDGAQSAILIPRGIKRDVFGFLRQRYPERAGRFHILQLFAVGAYLLLRPHLHRLEHVAIDREYFGHEGYIKGILLNYLRREEPSLPSDFISFRLVGEGSPSDKLAKSVFRGEQEPERVIILEEIVEVLK